MSMTPSYPVGTRVHVAFIPYPAAGTILAPPRRVGDTWRYLVALDDGAVYLVNARQVTALEIVEADISH